METSENLWIAIVIALAVGFIVGIIVARLAPRISGGQSSSTQAQLESLQLRFEEYQQEVASHFNTTASLVTRLNRSYQDIQEHLGQAAVELAPDDMTRQRLLAALEQENDPVSSRERIEPVFDTLEPPRDYATKTDEDPGMLSEEFGVKRK
ncbi:YhcB family protein [Halopseudomonas bauzanensis]|uniref:YhcB family protein n=1 Tax=Halopseudomonas bauzanensis TaxID=653930 RepID=UPI003524E663